MRPPVLLRLLLGTASLAALAPTPAAGDGAVPARADAAAAFFDEGRVHALRLTFAPGDLASLQATAPAGHFRGARPPGGAPPGGGPDGAPPGPPGGAPPGEDDFEYVPARLALDGGTDLKVAARWKGNSSWGWAQRHSKKSWKVDLDREVKDQTLLGLDKLNLQNAAMDTSLLRESLAYECYRRFGVPASRTTLARVSLAVEGSPEARDLGVYTVVEQVDGTFLKRVFGDDRGTLVKPERMGDLRARGARAGEAPSAEQAVEALGVKRKGRPEDRARLAAFVGLLDEDPAMRSEDFPARLAALLDVETFLRWWAMATLLGDVDTLAGFGHNAYLYVRPADGRVVLVPWDLNHAFGGMPMTPVEQSTDWGIDKPWTGSKRLFEHVMATPAWKERFRALLAEALDGPFSVAVLRAAIERRAAALREGFAEPEAGIARERWERSLTTDVERGPGGPGGPRPPRPGADAAPGPPREGPGFSATEPGLLSFVERRAASVRAQLAGTSKGTLIEGGPGGRAPRPGAAAGGGVAPPRAAPGEGPR